MHKPEFGELLARSAERNEEIPASELAGLPAHLPDTRLDLFLREPGLATMIFYRLVMSS